MAYFVGKSQGRIMLEQQRVAPLVPSAAAVPLQLCVIPYLPKMVQATARYDPAM